MKTHVAVCGEAIRRDWLKMKVMKINLQLVKAGSMKQYIQSDLAIHAESISFFNGNGQPSSKEAKTKLANVEMRN